MLDKNSSDSANSTSTTEITRDYSLSLYVTNILITLFTVSINGSVLLFLRLHRKKLSEEIFRQTLCLSVTDFLAGLTPATLCLLLLQSVKRSEIACVSVFGLYSCAQLAVLVNLCILSARRWLILRKLSEPLPQQRYVSVVVFIVCPWIVSFLLHSSTIAFRFATKQPRSSADGCKKKILGYNGLYLYPVLYLLALTVLIVFCILSIKSLRQFSEANASVIQRQRKRLQGKVVRHLLLAVFVSTATTLPIAASLALITSEFTSKTKILSQIYNIQSLNSLINPIIYSLYIKEIRNAMKENFVSLVCSICVRCRRRNDQSGVELASVGGDVFTVDQT